MESGVGAATEQTASEAAGIAGDGVLLNPHTYEGAGLDPASRRIMRATIEWFETRGKAALKEADHERTFYRDFLDFQASEKAFATLLTPERDGGGDPDKRWDTWRNCQFNEITGFYGLAYWYTWQVSILGLGPIFMSDERAAPGQAPAKLLDEGAIFAFGLSEQAHGADIYSTDMVLTADPEVEGGFRASGAKYYIGNGNEAGMVSVFGRREDIEGADGYVFFAADPKHPNYDLIKNVVNSQNYVSNFELDDYPVAPEDILHTGPEAFNAALNTINVGKFNLGFASIGICTHAIYEAITHAENRVLFGSRVTEFPHVRRLLADAYARLVAMKLFAHASDRLHALRLRRGPPLPALQPAHEDEGDDRGREGHRRPLGRDRRQGVREGHLLRDGGPRHPRAAEARGHRAREHGAGAQVHGRLPLQRGPEISSRCRQRRDAADDTFLFDQGPTRGLSKIQLRSTGSPSTRASRRVPNVAVFAEQAGSLKELLTTAPPDEQPAEGPRLPADARRAVHADPLRPADPRAGRADRPGRRHPRPDLRRPRPRLLRVTRSSCTARSRRPRSSRTGRCER